VDDTSKIVIYTIDTSLKVVLNEIFLDINGWFKTNLLSLNFSKTHDLEFRTRNFNDDNITVCYNNHRISNTIYTNFLGLIINDTLS
jgi:hypothetical protein